MIIMSLGGIPFYLEQIRRGESFAAAIERLCFAPTGILYHEYNNLFQALFKNAAIHQQIVGALAEKNYGLSHSEIQEAIGLKQASGTYQRAIEELLVSDFITEVSPWGKQKRGTPELLLEIKFSTSTSSLNNHRPLTNVNTQLRPSAQRNCP